ncbi:MAG: hypothetical protein KDA51_17240 [Planctomycetales bacterium]|nr:hypothetical protein [Planctomycetales bacterium]MCA9183213.1 hypothetical protein [Planctomycetales bacterium]
MSTDIPSQINIEIGQLPPNAQQRVLDFVRSLTRLGSGMSTETLQKHVGTIDPAEGRLMREAIGAGCEQVKLDGW